MARVCITTKSGSYCTASPITDCSCDRDPRFADPFPPVPPELNPALLLEDLKGVMHAAAALPGTKLKVIAQVVRLVLLSQVSVDDCWVITSLDCEAASKSAVKT